jgi:molybdenum cofactor biosynthesis enzyme MoaA
VVQLVALLRARHPALALAMTTNGTRLAALAAPLREAGLDTVNVSLDALDPGLFRTITRGGDVAAVLSGIRAARAAGLSVKLNTVLLGGVNDAEIPGLVDFAWSLDIVPRFIELMPLGEGARLPQARFVSAAQALAPIAHRLRDDPAPGETAHGPARYRHAADGSGRRVGVITALSDAFCGACNRLRLTARGELRACLASPDGMRLGASPRGRERPRPRVARTRRARLEGCGARLPRRSARRTYARRHELRRRLSAQRGDAHRAAILLAESSPGRGSFGGCAGSPSGSSCSPAAARRPRSNRTPPR